MFPRCVCGRFVDKVKKMYQRNWYTKLLIKISQTYICDKNGVSFFEVVHSVIKTYTLWKENNLAGWTIGGMQNMEDNISFVLAQKCLYGEFNEIIYTLLKLLLHWMHDQ